MRHAVLTELKRSFDFSGRTARAAYFCFLAASMMVFASTLATLSMLVSPEQFPYAVLWVTLLFYVPVTSAGVRRLHDVGESGSLMLDPLKPAFTFAMLCWVVPVIGGGLFSATLVFGVFFFPGVIGALAVLATLITAGLTLMYFSNTAGVLLLPSQPGPNRYGPNPHEVLT